MRKIIYCPHRLKFILNKFHLSSVFISLFQSITYGITSWEALANSCLFPSTTSKEKLFSLPILYPTNNLYKDTRILYCSQLHRCVARRFTKLCLLCPNKLTVTAYTNYGTGTRKYIIPGRNKHYGQRNMNYLTPIVCNLLPQLTDEEILLVTANQ